MIVLDPQDTGCNLPIKIWTPEKNFSPPDRDDSAAYKGWQLVWTQLNNLANHPLAVRHVCAMPDFHPGYGMPIGGVLATRGGVVPNAVGSDIGCGMIAQRLNIQADDLNREDLKALQQAIYKRVPVGFQRHNAPNPLDWGLRAPSLDPNLTVVADHYQQAKHQIGTLGGGNHFIELQRCDEDGRLWLMLHSGSRRIGKEVGDHYDQIAQAYMQSFKVDIDNALAFLPDTVPEYEQYLAEMRWCMDYAEANRQAMLAAVHDAFKSLGCEDMDVLMEVETHHNFAAMENHFGENLMIHRKGAVKATGLVTIPGSMGTASFIGEGLTPQESFNTCAHGGGRVLGRKEANRTITHDRAIESMADVVFEVREGEYDEMPDAYKPIDEVMAAQADLVKPLYRLTPLTVVKG